MSPLWSLIRHELLLQARQPFTLLVLLASAFLFGPVGMVLTNTWMGTTEQAVARATADQDLPIAADAGIAAWIEPGDGLRVTSGPLATRDPPGPDEVLAEARREGDVVTLRRPLKLTRSSEVERRFARVLERVNDARRDRALTDAGLTPADYVVQVARIERDVAARDGERVGRFLPGILVFLLITAALYTAIDVFTTEKEKGTAETLLATSLPRQTLLLGKAAVVYAVTCAIGAIWALSLWGAQAAGLLDLPELLGRSQVFTAGSTAMLLGAVLVLAAQVSAACVALAAWAPGFRQASVAAVPLMFALLAPTALTALPGVELDPLTIALPIANVGLALAASLAGGLDPLAAAWVVLASVGHAGLALGVLAWALARGDALDKGLDAEGRRASGRFGPDAVGAFVLALLGFWFFGMVLQESSVSVGLPASLVGLGAFGVATVAFLGAPLRETLSLRAPTARDAGLAVIAGLTMNGFGLLVGGVVNRVLPLDGTRMDALLDLPLPTVLVIAALVPGVCEELLFRGALFGLLRTSIPARLAVVVSAGMFGVFHIDPARIVTTACIGLWFGVLVLRSGSLWTGVIAHALNNALAFGLAASGLLWAGRAATLVDVLVWAAMTGVMALAVFGTRGHHNPS